MTFIGFAPGMTVLDLHAGAGYYSELLSWVVGEQGCVIAHNHPGARALLSPGTLERRYGNARLANVEQLFAKHVELGIPSASLDAVLISMAYHDTYWFDRQVDWGPVDQQALLAQLFDALKPRGVIGVIDHCAAAGTDPRQSSRATHRIDPAIVRRDFLAAGFELEAESDLLRNREDDHSRSVFDAAVHGRTDRFLLRLRRGRGRLRRVTPVKEAHREKHADHRPYDQAQQVDA